MVLVLNIGIKVKEFNFKIYYYQSFSLFKVSKNKTQSEYLKDLKKTFLEKKEKIKF